MKPTIFFDIDGVLARFTEGAARLFGRPHADALTGEWAFHRAWGLTDAEFYAPMGREFWAGLGRWEDGFALLRYVESLVGEDRIAFVTSPVETIGCREGKSDWFKTHLPQYKHHADLFIGGAKHKLAGSDKILIDDSDANCHKFLAAGGYAWTLPRPWNRARGKCAEDGTFNPLIECRQFQEFLESVS